MPNRMLRDWTQSDKMDELSCEAERFFVRLIMKADDFGGFWADTRLLKANLFPLKLDKIREADMLRWMAECQKAGLIVLYEVNQKRYVQIQDFRQRLDKAKAKFPLPPKNIDPPEIVTDFPAEQNRTRIELEPERAKALVAADAAPKGPGKDEYKKIIEDYAGKDLKTVISVMKEFLARRPDFVEPYKDYWNIAVEKSAIPKVQTVNDSRQKKLRVRLQEQAFDFVEIVRKVRESRKLMGDSSWFSFDWVFENQTNYVKIIEGNYDN